MLDRMRLCGALTFVIGLLTASPTVAQEGQSPAPSGEAPVGAPGEIFFDEQGWRSYAEGKTLYYEVSSGFYGKEYYEPGSNRVVYVFFDGQCFEGTWSVADSVFCFDYESRHCFYHLERDGQIIARSVSGGEQLVSKVTDERLSCRPQAVSDAGEALGAALSLASWSVEANR